MSKGKMAITFSEIVVLIIFMAAEIFMFFNYMDAQMVIGFILLYLIEYPLAVAWDELNKKEKQLKRYRD